MTRSTNPILFIFSGLPGTGKTTLARLLARRFEAAYLRIDTIEQGLRDLCQVDVEGEGYRLAYRIASDNLALGVNVVADSCNPIDLTRREWVRVALDAQAEPINIEVVCSDLEAHKDRVETRANDIEGLAPPTWRDVTQRTYDAWTEDRIVVDTASKPADACLGEITAAIVARPRTRS